MINGIFSTSAQADVQVARAQPVQPGPSAQKAAETKTPAANNLPQDTVHISQAAQQASQAMTEATESS